MLTSYCGSLLMGSLFGLIAKILFSLGLKIKNRSHEMANNFANKSNSSAQFFSSETALDELYARALIEIENGEFVKSVWAKALVVSNGEADIAKAQYIKMRVQQLKDDKTQ